MPNNHYSSRYPLGPGARQSSYDAAPSLPGEMRVKHRFRGGYHSYKINSELAQNNKSLTNDDLNSTLQDSSRDVINSSSFLVQKAEEHKKRRSLLSRMLTGNYYPGCYPFQFPPRGSNGPAGPKIMAGAKGPLMRHSFRDDNDNGTLNEGERNPPQPGVNNELPVEPSELGPTEESPKFGPDLTQNLTSEVETQNEVLYEAGNRPRHPSLFDRDTEMLRTPIRGSGISYTLLDED
ncbi:uncharacterized protein LOC142337806 isoform X1 [Convolutriloba macropyga]|uniref:uncharacterized protein LOC142337806 isoform X1 n=1 Tax=Convolutriloba macropyga TaxID=536237 RepID=UPI003F51ECD5